MKVTIERRELLEACILANRAISNRSTIPAMTCLFLGTRGKKMVIAGASGELAIEKLIKADISGDSVSLCVPPKTFGGDGNGIIGSLPDEEVTLDISENRVIISSSVGTSSVSGISAEDFPDLPKAAEKLMDVPDGLLSNIAKYIVPFVAGDREAVAKPQYIGVRLLRENNVLYAMTHDGLARASLWQEPSEGDNFDICIPSKVFRDTIENASLWKDAEGMRVSLKGKDVQISSSVYSGNWIDIVSYCQPRKAEYVSSFNISAKSLLDGVKLVNVVTDDVARSIKLDIQKETVLIGAESSKGKVELSLPITLMGIEQIVHLDGRYLQAILSVIGDNDVSIEATPLEYNGERVRFSAVRFEIVGDNRFVHVIVPRVSG